MKRKGGGKAGAGQAGGTIATGAADVNGDGKRRKLASGGITFKRPGEEASEDDEDDEEDDAQTGRAMGHDELKDESGSHPSGAKVVETSAIIIRDDD